MTLVEWLTWRLGSAIDYDGAYGAQCVDAANSWLEASGEKSRARSMTAAGIAHETWIGWTWVPNTAHNAPSPGDVVVWRAGVQPLGIGDAGHTAVCVLADEHGIISADQNWRGVARLTLWPHGYRGVAGWQHRVR